MALLHSPIWPWLMAHAATKVPLLWLSLVCGPAILCLKWLKYDPSQERIALQYSALHSPTKERIEPYPRRAGIPFKLFKYLAIPKNEKRTKKNRLKEDKNAVIKCNIIYISYYIIIQKSLRCGVIWCHLFSCLPALRSSSLEAPDVKPRREHKIYKAKT